MPDKKLTAFLKKENVYEKFMVNYKNDPDWRKIQPTGDIDISSAFIWADTPEGHDFWSNLDGKFIEIKTEKS